MSIYQRAWNSLVTRGPRDTLVRGSRAALRAAWPERAASFPALARRLRGLRGLEVGGPTPLFQPRQLVPIYPVVAGLDNVNFAARTVWEGEVQDAGAFRFDAGRRAGTQFVREATDLAGIEDGRYDFLASSHVLEHLANPLRAVGEWLRVLKPGGALLLVVPHREGTFDHRRPVTPLGHLVADFEAGTGENDLTHLPEILAHHDLSRDPGADPATFEQRSRDNFKNRCLHQHVFNTPAVLRLVDHLKLRILSAEARRPFHIIVLAEKVAEGTTPDNGRWLDPAAPHLRRSPFAGDREGGGAARR